jgi:hypothetical protein
MLAIWGLRAAIGLISVLRGNECYNASYYKLCETDGFQVSAVSWISICLKKIVNY